MVPKDGPGTAVHCSLPPARKILRRGQSANSLSEDISATLAMNGAERRRYYCNALPASQSHIGELAPMALCDIHVAGCGEHLPAWGPRDDRIPGTKQAVRGGRHGQKLHSGFPPRQGDARGSADARSSTDACLS